MRDRNALGGALVPGALTAGESSASFTWVTLETDDCLRRRRRE